MKRLLINDLTLNLGLMVWYMAAFLLPFHLGSAGTPWLWLLAYVPVAGLLFAVGDHYAGLSFSRRLGELPGLAVMRTLGLALPAAALFAMGQLLAPEAARMEGQVCALGGMAEMDEGTDEAPDLGISADAECVPSGSG
ncbi:MAG: hypothetical protein WA842_10225 [Croceibacterium sp.]